LVWAFEVVAYLERGRQPLAERLRIELRGAPVGDGWEPDVDYPLPTRPELLATIEAEFAAAGLNIPNVAERIAAWEAKHADAKITIGPLPPLSPELEAAADKIFGKASRRQKR
jgi:hypothetical protein